MKNTMTIELDPETGSIKYSKTVEFANNPRIHQYILIGSKYIPGADQKMFDELWSINKQLNEGIRRLEDAESKKM